MQTIQSILTWCTAHPAIFDYLGASLIAVLISKQTQVETWCAAHPWANLLLQLPRRFGFDLWGLLAALQVLWESRAKIPPIVTANTSIENIGGELVKTTIKTKVVVLPNQAEPAVIGKSGLSSLLIGCALLLSGCAALMPKPVEPCAGLYCLEWTGSSLTLPGAVLICAKTEAEARQSAQLLLAQDPKSTVRKVSR